MSIEVKIEKFDVEDRDDNSLELRNLVLNQNEIELEKVVDCGLTA